MRRLLLLSFSAIALACKGEAREAWIPKDPPPAVHAPSADSAFVGRFLAYLGSDLDSAALANGFDASKGGHWNADSVLAYLSDTVAFHDVNGDSTWRATHEQIRAEIAARRGKSFGTLVHLAHIAAIPYSQYSSIKVSRDTTGVFAMLGTELYRLDLVGRGAGLRVSRIAYLELEGE